MDLVERLQSTAWAARRCSIEWEGLWYYLARQKDNLTSPHAAGRAPARAEPDRATAGTGAIPRRRSGRSSDRRVDALLQVQTIAFENAARRILAMDPRTMRTTRATRIVHPAARARTRAGEAAQRAALVRSWTRITGRSRSSWPSAKREESVADESDEEAAFDDTPEGERLHRYQTQWSRTLRRTFDEIERLHGQTEDEPTAPPRVPARGRTCTRWNLMRSHVRGTCRRPSLWSRRNKATARSERLLRQGVAIGGRVRVKPFSRLGTWTLEPVRP